MLLNQCSAISFYFVSSHKIQCSEDWFFYEEVNDLKKRNRCTRQHQRREVKEGPQGATLKHLVEQLCLNFCLCDDRKRQLPGSAIRDHSNYANRSNIYGCCVLKSVDNLNQVRDWRCITCHNLWEWSVHGYWLSAMDTIPWCSLILLNVSPVVLCNLWVNIP